MLDKQSQNNFKVFSYVLKNDYTTDISKCYSRPRKFISRQISKCRCALCLHFRNADRKHYAETRKMLQPKRLLQETDLLPMLMPEFFTSMNEKPIYLEMSLIFKFAYTNSY